MTFLSANSFDRSTVSVLDDLRRAQEQLVARMNELEPLVAEYQELRQEADRLGLAAAQQDSSSAPETTAGAGADAPADPAEAVGTETAAPAASTPAQDSPAPAKAARSGRRASRPAAARSPKRQPGGSRGGSRESAILQLVANTPGITVTAAGKQLGVDPTGLYRPVRKLVAEGRIAKRGPALHPAE